MPWTGAIMNLCILRHPRVLILNAGASLFAQTSIALFLGAANRTSGRKTAAGHFATSSQVSGIISA
jgi:hypothetical protein